MTTLQEVNIACIAGSKKRILDITTAFFKELDSNGIVEVLLEAIQEVVTNSEDYKQEYIKNTVYESTRAISFLSKLKDETSILALLTKDLEND